MDILQKNMHHIDFEEVDITEVSIDGQTATEFINNIINETFENEGTREYKQKSDYTEVISIIKEIIRHEEIENQDDTGNGEVAVAIDTKALTNRIAEKLMESEIKAQEEIASIGKIRKGSLIQALAKSNENTYRYVLIKVDHSAYLDKNDLVKRIGLPLEEKILKSCIIEYNLNKDINRISLFDSTKKMANYWWNKLLELEPIRTDDLNTKTAMRKIKGTIKKVVETNSPSDYTIYNDKLKGYFNTREEFDIEEMISTVIDGHNTKDQSVDTDILKEKIRSVALKTFDGQFKIDLSAIKNDKVEVYKLDERISLTLYDEIGNLPDKIIAEENGGEYSLRLVGISKDIYDKFNY
ncbi:hypothetical protein ACOV1W_03730 [Paraclostridium bifermentans]|uniref:hypothetical protein n=1 Tax=Paraclostridium bifermentans TaxID=1490 RepID=UPI003D2DC887